MRRPNGWQKEESGWLVNKDRRERRDQARTFTDNDGLKLIEKIDSIENYTKSSLGSEIDRQMRLRDKAIISCLWVWFKRGSEVLGLKRKDVILTDREILISFTIAKKKRKVKYCPECQTKNGSRNDFCRKCGIDLKNVSEEIVTGGDDAGSVIKTKSKVLGNTFVKFIIEWLTEYDKIGNSDGWLFPSLRVIFTKHFFDFGSEKPMTIQNLDTILKKLDPSMTSCLFRYGGSEKYLSLGYTPYEMKEIGDWESTLMPEKYAAKKGLTIAQRKWSEDVR